MRCAAFVPGAILVSTVVAAWAFCCPRVATATNPSQQQRVEALPATEDQGSASADTSEFSFWDHPRVVPEIQFDDRHGHPLTLKAFRGKPIILNIWAPWCIPCREEMPALDRLQAEIGAAHLHVLPLSVDRRGLPAVEKFYRDQRLTSLGIYLDQSGDAASRIDGDGVPMTLLIDRGGREVGRRLGALEWDDPKVVMLIRQRLGLGPMRQRLDNYKLDE